ncbi:hypothetical protein BD779DRAFT_1157937 [Infundibulicybe gibba]|nr:hypothetical protein BD779DRAFT_1157937 [Infundibulicybe gibba]
MTTSPSSQKALRGPVSFGFPLAYDQMFEYTLRFMTLSGIPIARGQSGGAVALRMLMGRAASEDLSAKCARIYPGAHITSFKCGLYMMALVRSACIDDSLIPGGEQMAALKRLMIGEGFDEEPCWFFEDIEA